MSTAEVAELGDPKFICPGTCSASRIEHVHFDEGFPAYVASVAAAALGPEPELPDPAVQMTERFTATFSAVWGAMAGKGASDDLARAKAADIAAAILGLRLGQ